jgi:transposase-like protein
MSRRYTDEEKRIVLERLIANRGDVSLTADQTGVTTTTIYKWKKLANLHISPLSPLSLLSPNSPYDPVGAQRAAPSPESAPPPLAPDDAQALQDLKRHMLENAELLNTAIAPAIEDASLSERVMALIRLVDRIHRLSIELPAKSEPIKIELADSEGEEPDGDEDSSAKGTRQTEEDFAE